MTWCGCGEDRTYKIVIGTDELATFMIGVAVGVKNRTSNVGERNRASNGERCRQGKSGDQHAFWVA